MTKNPAGSDSTREPDAVAPSSPSTGRSRLLVGVAVIALFGVIIGVRLLDTLPGPQAGDGAQGSAPASADPVVVLDGAIAAGQPIFVFFHSGSCAPCIEMEGVVERVLPSYEGVVAFVDAKTDDPRTGPLFSRFAFQYIPTSFFVAPGGAIFDQHTGVLTDDEMRARLDALVEVGG